ncbi:hypothetical protein MNV49_003667 [Pseudohyphozyma bogoriensis]|nr:hypothetical protein MNV49_003667 [Pseudohyphozyma bogoriensis]
MHASLRQSTMAGFRRLGGFHNQSSGIVWRTVTPATPVHELSFGRLYSTESEHVVRHDHHDPGKPHPHLIRETVTQTMQKTTVEEIPSTDGSAADAQHGHEVDPHHPGKSDIDHLSNPSMSEETVHADRLDGVHDPLPDEAKKNKGTH